MLSIASIAARGRFSGSIAGALPRQHRQTMKATMMRETPDLLQWMATLTKLRRLLGRGHGNHNLVSAYRSCGIPGRPKVTCASETRMVVYAAAVLRQSFKHFRPRYMATWNFYEELAAAQRQRRWKRKKAAQLVKVGRRLANCEGFFMALQTHAVLSMPGGFLACAQAVQQTEQVFSHSTCLFGAAGHCCPACAIPE